MSNMFTLKQKLKQKLTKSKGGSPVETKVIQKTVHEVHYKDKFGRWLRHAAYDSAEAASGKGVRAATKYVQSDRKANWGNYVEPGKAGPTKNPHGD